MRRAHHSLSTAAIAENYDVDDHNLTQSDASGYQVGGTQQYHHECTECHCQSRGGARQPGRPDDPEAQDSRTEALDGGVEPEAAPAQCVAEGCVGDDKNDGDIGERREGYLSSEGGWSVDGGAANYGASQGGPKCGG